MPPLHMRQVVEHVDYVTAVARDVISSVMIKENILCKSFMKTISSVHCSACTHAYRSLYITDYAEGCWTHLNKPYSCDYGAIDCNSLFSSFCIIVCRSSLRNSARVYRIYIYIYIYICNMKTFCLHSYDFYMYYIALRKSSAPGRCQCACEGRL